MTYGTLLLFYIHYEVQFMINIWWLKWPKHAKLFNTIGHYRIVNNKKNVIPIFAHQNKQK